MPEAVKVATAADSGTMSGPLVPVTGRPDGASADGRRWDMAGAAMRAATVVSSLLALALMVSAEQRGELSLLGFHLPLYSKWSFSDSLEFEFGSVCRPMKLPFVFFGQVSGGDLCGGGGAFAAATSIDREEAGEEDAGHPVPSSRVGYICWRSGFCICYDECGLSCSWDNQLKPHRDPAHCTSRLL
ncbi:uncharacterized protein [Elaeis guineensis]|uniref:uncharacterized protein isoform X2 n=1 Tax=Elaeis guineensis var. tenera TaxID=51953 RepID=UPI003C6D04C5